MANRDKDSSSSDGYAQTAPLSDERPSSGEAPGLGAGELVAERYRVVRFLARGGMGEVYEVEDRELRERIALKTIREERKDGVAEALFLREIQLSRKVTHPNVCRIFDVGHHERTDGTHVVFFTMELLSGATLHDRIIAEGPLPMRLANSVARQMMAALASAHGAGIVHRDLKSANVMLEHGNDKVRAVVTDFGLAHSALTEGVLTLSGSGGIVGTPAYMAPEQVEGGAVTESTDVYALGVVMYEMVTGRLPFEGGTALAIAARRLTVAAPSAKKLRSDLPARWEQTIAACLERDPKRRPASARAVLELLDTQPGESIRLRKLHRRVPLVRPAVALALLVVTVLVGLRLRREQRDSLPVALPERGVVFGDFVVEGPPSGHALAARNALRVSLLGDVPLVGTQIVVGHGLTEVKLGVEGPRRHGEPLVLSGRLRVDATQDLDRVELSVLLVDPATKRERFSAVESGSVLELPDVLARIAERLRVAARLRPLSVGASAHASAAQIRDALSRHELAAALDEVERAVIDAPQDVELRLLYAQALDGLQLDVAHEVVLRRLATLGAIADPVLHARVAARVDRADVTRVIPLLEALHATDPTDLEIGAQLVEALTGGQRTVEAAQISSELAQHARNPDEKLLARIVELTREANSDEEYKLLGAYRAVVDEATRLARPGLAVSALELGCLALVDNDTLHAKPECDELASMGKAQRRPDALVVVALARAEVTGPEGSREHSAALVRGRQLAEELGSYSLVMLFDTFLAADDALQGQSARTDKRYDEAIALARLDHEPFSLIEILASRALEAGEQGDLDTSARYRQESYELAADSSDKEMTAFTRCQEVREDVNGGALEKGALVMSKVIEPSASDDPLTIECCRASELVVVLEQGRASDTAAVLARFDKDPVLTAYGWGRWVAAETRAVVAYEHWDGLALERAATRALSQVPPTTDRSEYMQPQVLAAIGRILVGKPAPTPVELKTLVQLVTRLSPRATTRQIQVELLTLRRLSGEPPQLLLTELDRVIEQLSRPNSLRRQGLWARVERLRLYAATHDARLATEGRELVENAKALGYELVAQQAAKILAAR